MLVGVTHFGKYMDHEIEINILNFRRIFNFQDVYTKNCLINSICFDDKLKLLVFHGQNLLNFLFIVPCYLGKD